MNEDDRGARYSDLFGTKHEHDVANCAYCPICAGIGVLRSTNPEVLEHLTAAARELIVAGRILLDEAAEVVAAAEKASASRPRPTESKVRRIDVG